MTPTVRTPRRGWHALSDDEKRQRLTVLRRRQQEQVESELRLLAALR